MGLTEAGPGRRRVTIRKRDDHPRRARAKARYERVVDLHEPRTLDAVNRHVLHERPSTRRARSCFWLADRVLAGASR